MALFAPVALATLLQHWGYSPDFLIDIRWAIAAAHLAGGVVADRWRVCYARGRLMAELPAGGVMVVVAASEEEVLPVLVDGESRGINAPHSVVQVRGSGRCILSITLRRRGRRVHRLAVSHASFVADGTDACRVHGSPPVFRVETVDSVGVLTVPGMAGAGYGDGSTAVRCGGAPVRFAGGRPVAECGWGHKVC